MLNLPTKSVIVLITIVSMFFYSTGAAYPQTKAQDIVERYMDSLISGDIESIKQCLGEDLQERRKKTFKDPTYSQFLIDHYDGAIYRILDVQELANGDKLVDVRIIFKSSATMAVRLLLNKGNRIIDEIIY